MHVGLHLDFSVRVERTLDECARSAEALGTHSTSPKELFLHKNDLLPVD